MNADGKAIAEPDHFKLLVHRRTARNNFAVKVLSGFICGFQDQHCEMDLADAGPATEWRKRIAHGVSRGEKCAIAESPVRGDRIPAKEDFLSPLRGSIANTSTHG